MQHLRVLKLIDNPLLETLPKSLSDAQMLEELELRCCSGIKAINATPINLQVFIFENISHNHEIQSLSESLSISDHLRDVQISGCTSLKEIKITGKTSIKSFSLSDSSITSLSLYGCRELVRIELIELHELEDLNLSSTAITEIPDISRLPKLRQFVLHAVPHLRRACWHELNRIPMVFNLVQCDFIDTSINDLGAIGPGKYNQRNLPSETVAGVRISVWDSHLFLNLHGKHCTYLLERGYLHSFYISVVSYKKKKEVLSTTLSQTIISKPFEWNFYKDASLKALAPMPSQVELPRCHRYIEICSTECYPDCLEGILEITELLSVKDNIHISSVSDLNPRLSSLLALQVEGCHKIEGMFKATYGEHVGQQLLFLHVAHLHNMTTLLIEKESPFQKSDFGSLKNLHLDQCLKLEKIFPDNVSLPSLEMLIITHCVNLQTMFYNSGYYDFHKDVESAKELQENHLQSLHTMRFHCLPQLLHIYKEQRVGAFLMPMWRTFCFRDCWALQQLPLLTGSREQKVCVDGESLKCDAIKSQMDRVQLSHYEFKSPPPVASLKGGVKNRIFLK